MANGLPDRGPIRVQLRPVLPHDADQMTIEIEPRGDVQPNHRRRGEKLDRTGHIAYGGLHPDHLPDRPAEVAKTAGATRATPQRAVEFQVV